MFVIRALAMLTLDYGSYIFRGKGVMSQEKKLSFRIQRRPPVLFFSILVLLGFTCSSWWDSYSFDV
jgi:uncharacterized membrane protein